MLLGRIVDLGSNVLPWEQPSHTRGHVHHLVCFTVHAVSDVKGKTQESKSNLWYTIKPQVRGSSKSKAVGKIKSKAISCGAAEFDTEHEVLIDAEMVHALVLKVKATSSVLHRKVTIGTYKLNIASLCQSALDEVAVLTDKKGEAAGNIHVSATISRTPLPGIHFAPQPFLQPSPTTLVRPYASLACKGEESRLVSFSQGRECTIQVQGNDHHCEAKQAGRKSWEISEKAVSFSSRSHGPTATRKLWLECTPVQRKGDESEPSHPMRFSLQDERKTASSLVLVPGNVANGSSEEAAWGTWTLVRKYASPASTQSTESIESSGSSDSDSGDSRDAREDEFLALINLAGPVVETWAAKEVPLALVIANSMFWSCMLHSPAQLMLYDKIEAAVSRKFTSSSWGRGSGAGSFEHGYGFFVLGEDVGSASDKKEKTRQVDVTELRAKMSGVGSKFQAELQFLRFFFGSR